MGELIVEDDMMQCTLHPFKTASPGGGICPLCLQDKLGKLVSSSSSFLPISSSSSSASVSASTSTTTTTISFPSRVPLQNNKTVLNRSKSTAHYTTTTTTHPRRRGFWSFFHLPLKKTSSSITATATVATQPISISTSTTEAANTVNTTPKTASFVTRSRSVGCGNRSFSGDFFDKISTGLGDCTLRRVESQREGGGRIKHRHSTSTTAIREKVLCGGLFGGFMMITTSTSSSSYWTSTDNPNPTGRGGHGRWGWALPSPRRPFSSSKTHIANNTDPNTKDTAAANNNNNNSNSNKPTNLGAIPTLLSVRP